MSKKTKPLAEMTLEELWQLFPIILSEPKSEWKDFYQQEKDLLEKYFAGHIAKINHIGSTAVDNLIAKPTVDILLEIAETTPPDTIRQIALECGYTVMQERLSPDYRLDLCKGYTPQGFAEKVYHLHICRPKDHDETVFRDYLNSHPEKAREYAELKINLQKRFKHNRDAYTDAKGDFIKMCVKEARNQKNAIVNGNMADRTVEEQFNQIASGYDSGRR